ncbi:peptidoglycan-binding protein [Coleofasciculus sp. FACHB-SPT36]|uniref:peptidoglycan-binding domain-containing protein n=1 Tax=Cyanophyceae TaxID=3028117 RepID=UPI00168B9768|nr:peptidoglycan-binding protein [Coleofasciculus sp. FACHB-SPT36]MBD2540047.1 peptidoglycan-binding protein [Coleofasciculus sp. FACHB-SPT36]
MLAKESTQISVKPAQLNKPVLQIGNSGAAVKELQQLLTKRFAYNGAINGNFNGEVEFAVLVFQNWMFLKEDGVVGQMTWQALYTGAPVNMPVLKRGAKGEIVITLQSVLSLSGDFDEEVNGIFGPHTEAAVRSFQLRSGLLADGIVGEKTWYGLSKVRQQIGGC